MHVHYRLNLVNADSIFEEIMHLHVCPSVHVQMHAYLLAASQLTTLISHGNMYT